MGSEIAISVTREETRVAVLENRVVTELFVDRPRKKDFVGDIYKGKVIKVLPGMQAAFVDIGSLFLCIYLQQNLFSLPLDPQVICTEQDWLVRPSVYVRRHLWDQKLLSV